MLLVLQPMISGFIQFIQDCRIATLFDFHNDYYRPTKLLFNNMVYFRCSVKCAQFLMTKVTYFAFWHYNAATMQYFYYCTRKKLLPQAIFAKISSQTTHS